LYGHKTRLYSWAERKWPGAAGPPVARGSEEAVPALVVIMLLLGIVGLLEGMSLTVPVAPPPERAPIVNGR
jgi:uncharacterized iron-regulated membrane protein